MKTFVRYTTNMNEYLSKGHAAKLTSGELLPTEEKFVWYLPHHPVFHPRKPGKVRVVFDCAANFLGVSLNDMLLQGPDLNNNLIGVLMRFRKSLLSSLLISSPCIIKSESTRTIVTRKDSYGGRVAI